MLLPLRFRRPAGLLIITLSMLLALVVAAPVAARKSPAGNNGTVKVDGVAWDNHPDNEPHVGCRFEVDFYGFDEGNLWADVVFEAQPPTGRGLLLSDRVFIGHDDNSGGGSEAGWDASRQYDLTAALGAYTAHPQQGYHVKLTVHADGSQGADTKHKVFWVGPCQATTLTRPSNPPSTPPGGGTGGGSGGNGNTPREDTASGGSDPVALLPDTALDPAASSLAHIAGMLLLGGSATLRLVAVRRSRSRRR